MPSSARTADPAHGGGQRDLSRRGDRVPRATATAVALAVGGLAAAPVAAPALTLDQAVERALAANPSARAAQLEALAARERTAQARARRLGDVDLVGTATRYESARLVRPIAGPLNPAATASLPFDRDQLHEGVSWQIPLFTGGALTEAVRAARSGEASAAHAAAWARDEVWYRVRAAYRGALGLQHALTAAGAYEEALARDEASARLRVTTEAWSRADADKVSFALASARARKAALGARLDSAIALLDALMGDAPLAAHDELQDTPSPHAGAVPDLRALGATARERRPDLLAAREEAETQRRREAGVRAGFWPQIGFSGNYLLNDGRSVGRPLQTWELTLQVKLPLLSDVGRAFAVREAVAESRAVAEQVRAKTAEVEAQVIDAVGRVESARAALAAGEAQHDLGAEIARVEKLRFEAGTGKVEDYLAARAEALQGETVYWESLYELQTARDWLRLASGEGGAP